MTFRNLSPRQAEAFEQIAIGNDSGHNQRILVALLRKNLITRSQEWQADNTGRQFYAYRYEVPLSIHLEWCTWCAEQ